MGLFSGIGGARAANSANYVRCGRYLAIINKVRQTKNRKGGDLVAIEMTCIHRFADGPTAMGDLDSRPHQVGENFSDVISSAQGDYFLPKVKSFVMRTCRVTEESITEEDIVAILSDAQPLAGLVVEVTGRPHQTATNKRWIVQTIHNGPVGVARLGQILTPESIQQWFPGDGLERLAQMHANLYDGQNIN